MQNYLEPLEKANKYLNLPKEKIEILKNPERVVEVNFPVVMDSEATQIFKGYRVQHNNARGPYKGGIRYHQQVDMEEIKALAFWMSMKCALMDIPYGGGKGGVSVDPKKLSETELENLTKSFIRSIADIIGPHKDVPAPDVNTNTKIMGWMIEELKNLNKTLEESEVLATVTGKPREMGGSEGRVKATGLGGFYVLEETVTKLGWKKPLTVAIQGFGNVGSNLAEFLFENNYQVIAVSDSKGGILDFKGLDIPKVIKGKKETGLVKDSVPAESLTNESLLEVTADILVPSALENQITKDNAANIKAKLVLEMANGPTSPEADEILSQKGVVVIPDILANGGGVTVSYFEWQQNLAQEHWSEEEVNQKLKEITTKSFNDLWVVREKYSTDLRTAAYILALERISSSMRQIS